MTDSGPTTAGSARYRTPGSESGYAPALHHCPHVQSNVRPLPFGVETKDIEPDDNQCDDCDNTEENWLCLTCHTIHCGRFASSHALGHATITGHCVAAGFADLSFWCYQCESYLHHLSMQPIYAMYCDLHQMKFGEPAVEVPEFAHGFTVDTLAEGDGQANEHDNDGDDREKKSP